MKKMYRQGDVILIRVDKKVKRGKDAREKGRTILAHGEVTGHAHEVFAPTKRTVVEFFDGVDAMAGTRFLEVVGKPAELRHQEHATIELPEGTYEVRRQREYTPERIINVAD